MTNENDQPPPSYDDASTHLAEVRGRLEEQIEALRASAAADSGGISFGKRIGEGTSLAVERIKDVAVHDRLVEQLSFVDRAQAKRSEGTAEVCDECGGTIDADRLAALPWSIHCVGCAEAGLRPEPEAPANGQASAAAPTTRPTVRPSESPWHQALGGQLPSSRD